MIGKSKITKKKMILYGVIIATMILGNIFIYFKNSNIPDIELDSNNLVMKLESEVAVKSQASRTKAVIENNLFITLEKIGDWPVVPKNIGKADPFVPFFNSNIRH